MKKATIVPTVLAIICSLTFMNMVTVDAHIPSNDGIYPVLTNCYPNGIGTYTNTSIDISINYYYPKNSVQINAFSYSLDGKPNSTLSYSSKDGTESIVPSIAIVDPSKYIHYSIFGSLENLTNSEHALAVYAYFLNGTIISLWNQKFTVDTNFVPPKLIIISPQNQITYNNDVPIIFNINSDIIWQYYALDKFGTDTGDWIPFKGNITLSGLPEGNHTIIVSIQTEASRQTSTPITQQTISFNVSESIPLRNQLTIIAMIAAVIIMGVLLYKRTKAEDTNK